MINPFHEYIFKAIERGLDRKKTQPQTTNKKPATCSKVSLVLYFFEKLLEVEDCRCLCEVPVPQQDIQELRLMIKAQF